MCDIFVCLTLALTCQLLNFLVSFLTKEAGCRCIVGGRLQVSSQGCGDGRGLDLLLWLLPLEPFPTSLEASPEPRSYE